MERPELVLRSDLANDLANDLGNNLTDVDLKQTERNAAYHFSNQIAEILRKRFTSNREFKSLISRIIVAGRIDELMASILKFYNSVVVNHIIKIQLKKVYEVYSLGTGERTKLVAECLEKFSKMPSDQKLYDTLLNEIVSVFRMLEEPVFVELLRVLYKSGIVRDLYITAFGISAQPAVFKMDDPEDETAILKCSSYILYCYKNIISALETICKNKDSKETSEYEMLSARESQLNTNIPLDKLKLAELTAHPKLVAFLNSEWPTLKRLDKEPNLTIGKSSIVYVEKTKRDLNQILQLNKQKLFYSVPDNQRQYSKKVLNMTSHLVEMNQLENIRLDIDPNLIASNLVTAKYVISKRSSRTKCEVLLKHEKTAAFARQGVIIVEVVDDVGGLDASLLKFLRLYEGALTNYIPQRIWVQLAFAGLSVYFTRKTILDQNDITRSARIYKAIMKGTVFLTFNLNIAIKIFIEYNPDVKNISNIEFWLKVALAPILFSIENIIWNAFTPLENELFCRKRACGHGARVFGDVVNDSFYNAGVIFAFTNTFFKMPTALGYQFLYIFFPGFLTAMAQHFSPAREKVNLVIRYLIGIIFSFTFARSEYPGSPERRLEQGWQSYIRLGLGLGLSSYSIYFVIKTWRRFSEDYINEETKADIIIKNIKVSVTKDSSKAPTIDGLLISDSEYTELKTDMAEGREERALSRIEENSKTLIFSDTFETKENIRLSLLGKTKDRHKVSRSKSKSIFCFPCNSGCAIL